MVGRPRKVPSYCRHKASGQAVVRINGGDVYLGVYGTPESHERYQRAIAEHLGNGDSDKIRESSARSRGRDLTVVELIAAYWEYVRTYYVKNGEPTSEQNSLRLALRPLKMLYGSSPVVEFGPLALENVRDRMIDHGLTRKRINQHIQRIRRMFEWGVSKELLPVEVFQALKSLKGLRQGRTRAKESTPIQPVDWNKVEAVLPYLPSQIQSMIKFQFLVGCRPEEVTIIRPSDIYDREQEVWEYVPNSHKTEHHNRQRRIFVGGKAQAVLLPWLDRPAETYCFSPIEARAAFDAERRNNRKTPHTPTSRKRKRKRKPRRKPGEHYTTGSYGQAIRQACKKAGIVNWSPNQLRHSRGTEIRKAHGLEASQVVLGHSKADVTQIYAERDFGLAREVMREIG